MLRAIAIALVLLAVLATCSKSEETCRTIRGDAQSVLMQCGQTFRSYILSTNDMWRRIGQAHGRIVVVCALEVMCADEPDVAIGYISPGNWNKSRKDAHAIYDALRESLPMHSNMEEVPLQTCPMFKLPIGEMTGNAICYGDQGKNWNAVVTVVSDDYFGMVMTFLRDNEDASQLQKKVSDLVTRFRLDRKIGADAVHGWLK
jgi:hypothetical protein